MNVFYQSVQQHKCDSWSVFNVCLFLRTLLLFLYVWTFLDVDSLCVVLMVQLHIQKVVWAGFLLLSSLKSEVFRTFCTLFNFLPVSTKVWFITSVDLVFHDTSFFHLSNYTPLMCSFSPASLLLPPPMCWHNSFWPRRSCRSTEANFLCSL